MGRRKCLIKGCKSVEYSNMEKISFFSLKRSNQIMNNHWIRAINSLNSQNVLNYPKTAVICSKHFNADNFVPGINIKLKPDAIPTIFPRSDMEDVEYLIPESEDEPENQMSLSTSCINTMDFHNNIFEKTHRTEIHSTFPLITHTQQKRIAYPAGDIRDNLNDATPMTLVKCISVLRSDRFKYKQQMKRLKDQNSRQKVIIKKVNTYLQALKKKNLIMGNAAEVLKTNVKF